MLSEHFRDRGVPLLDLPSGGAVPLGFSSPVAEHLATRTQAGLFDFSFMGWWEVAGRDSAPFVARLQTRHLGFLEPGKLAYTLLCDERGMVLNDATVWRLAPDRFWIFTGRRTDGVHLHAAARGQQIEIVERSKSWAVLAVQGPASARVLTRVIASKALATLGYFAFMPIRIAGHDGWIGRLGYSGELGYELAVPLATAVGIWDRLLAAGRQDGLVESGFEAANSLRIESGYILFSAELARAATPFELGLGRLVASHTLKCIGGVALAALHRQTPTRRLVGLVLTGEHVACIPWRGSVRQADVTSECFSPTLQRRLALAFVDSTAAQAGTVVYTPAGRRGRVCRLPFYDPPRIRPRRAPVA